jgi:hypothetical protein
VAVPHRIPGGDAPPNGVLIQVYRPAGRLQYGEEPLPT